MLEKQNLAKVPGCVLQDVIDGPAVADGTTSELEGEI
jgi:hypothetical protein